MSRLPTPAPAMKPATPIDFDQLDELLQQLGALQGAAELHGFLVGQLVTGKRFSRSEWLRAANEEADLGQSPDEVAGDRLYDLYRTTLAALRSGELEFQLLLPDDDTALLDRVDRLGRWCEGFLTGFGLAGSSLPIDGELADALRDIAAIAQIGASEDEAALESSESDLFTISEYVRLTAIEIFHSNAGAGGNPESGAPAAASPADLFKRDKLH